MLLQVDGASFEARSRRALQREKALRQAQKRMEVPPSSLWYPVTTLWTVQDERKQQEDSLRRDRQAKVGWTLLILWALRLGVARWPPLPRKRETAPAASACCGVCSLQPPQHSVLHGAAV